MGQQEAKCEVCSKLAKNGVKAKHDDIAHERAEKVAAAANAELSGQELDQLGAWLKSINDSEWNNLSNDIDLLAQQLTVWMLSQSSQSSKK